LNIIDRRANPSGKSLANRQRFIERAKGDLREAVSEALKSRKVSDIGTGEKVSIPAKNITEPTFRRASQGGRREVVVPGNKEYVAGDHIERPPSGGGGGRGKAADDGEGEDAFGFALTREEFLDILFDDMELPNLVKTEAKGVESHKLTRAGHSTAGSPSNINMTRTLRNSLARRISLGRPKLADIKALEEKIEQAEQAQDEATLAQLLGEIAQLKRRAKVIAFIDPTDIRYNLFLKTPNPISQAVMFCLMDVSGSMTEHMKELAKRFFMLLHVFLSRRYRKVDIVFIRHTTVASEVDENTFFHSRDTGGTIVSSALEEMARIVRERYPLDTWNVYAAQASDGDNIPGDSSRCHQLLRHELLPQCQYFAYIEVGDRRHSIGFHSGVTTLWQTYAEVAAQVPYFAMRQVSEASQIFPVFYDLFAKSKVEQSEFATR
jgi:uncharacterized sporulation protein YeaH/YhbH (DUF444 family)